MKNVIAVIMLCLLMAANSAAETTGATDTEDTPDNSWAYLGFSGSIEIAMMRISGEGLDLVSEAGYGSISRDGFVPLLAGGVNLRKPSIFDLALSVSVIGGGSFDWNNVFGDFGNSFSLYGEALSVQLEIQPLFPFLRGFHPFIGGGYSIKYGLVDNVHEGFVKGQGPFVGGGLYMFSLFGRDSTFFYHDDKSFAGLRLSVYYRFPYAYQFELDWSEFAADYAGMADVNTIKSFFQDATFPSESLTISLGLCLGLMPFGL